MNAVSVDVMDLLNGTHGTKGTDLFAMEWGETDKQALIIDTGGFQSDLKELYEQPTFQILVRGGKDENANTAYIKIRNIYEFLIEQDTIENLMQFEPLSPPSSIGRDENDRMVFTCNFYTFRNPK